MEQNQKVSKKVKIVTEPANYEATGEFKITTNVALAKAIANMFKETFADFYGCTIDTVFNPSMSAYIPVPTLIFKVLPKEYYNDNTKMFAFTPFNVGNSGEGDLIARLRSTETASATGCMVNMTDEMKSVISDFITAGFAEQIRRHSANYENMFRPDTSNGEVYIFVSKLDIIKFLEKIYGGVVKNEDGTTVYQYNCTCMYKRADNVYGQKEKWVLSIMRLNSASIEKNLNDIGIGFYNNAFNSNNSILANVVTA